MAECAWKDNWDETKAHLTDWWNRDGFVFGAWSPVGGRKAREEAPGPGPRGRTREWYTDPLVRAQANHWRLARASFPGDVLAKADCDTGPGSLALYLGSEPVFAETTVWFGPVMEHDDRPEARPPLAFDPDDRWWRITAEALTRCRDMGRGKYLVGCPDLVENIDILASLRGTQRLLLDMAERPGWVAQKVEEINQVWFAVFQRIYDIIKLADGSSTFGAFSLWGPGKTAKVQADASAMISPAMFRRLVLPALTRQCKWLDHSMFHLDGHQCLCHLDALLSIDALDAIEWTTDPQVPTGGDPCWYGLYRRILDAGKSVQVPGVQREHIVPLLDAVGPKGMYIMTAFEGERSAEQALRLVEPYR